jgi:hypothetical protein
MNKKQRSRTWLYLWPALLFLAYIIVLFSHSRAPQLGDYADWSYEGVLLHHTILGDPNLGSSLKHYPVPNSLVAVGIGALCFLFPWKIAAKVWLVLYLALSFAVIYRVLRGRKEISFVVWLIVPAIFTGLDFWYGFINFLMALLLTIWFSCLLLEDEKSRWKYACLLVLIFFAHFIPFAFAILLFFLYVLQTKRFRLLWQALPAVLLTFWYVIGRFTIGRNVDDQLHKVTVGYFTPAFGAFKINTYLKSFAFINPEWNGISLLRSALGDVGFVVLFLLNGMIAVAVFVMVFQALQSSFRERRNDRFFWIAFLVALPVYLLAPVQALGVSDPGARILQTVLWAALPFVVFPRRIERFLGAALVIFSLTNLVFFACLTMSLPPIVQNDATKLPHAIVGFASVRYTERRSYYYALDAGYLLIPVFRTGIFRPVPGAGTNATFSCVAAQENER